MGNKLFGKVTALYGEIVGYISSPWEGLKAVPDRLTWDDAMRLEGVYIAKISFENGDDLIYPSLSGGRPLLFNFRR